MSHRYDPSKLTQAKLDSLQLELDNLELFLAFAIDTEKKIKVICLLADKISMVVDVMTAAKGYSYAKIG